MRRSMRLRKAIKNHAGLIAFVIGMLFFRTGVADWSYVSSGSMEPNLYEGDWMLVSKREYGPSIPFTDFRLMHWGQPERGDVITFYPPHDDALYVKRVIGVPGDAIAVSGRDIFVNGRKLEAREIELSEDARIVREEIDGAAHRLQYSRGDGDLPVLRGELIVPPRKYFVLGDHRDNSADSRFWGFVDEQRIVGRVTHVAVSFARQRPLAARVAVAVE